MDAVSVVPMIAVFEGGGGSIVLSEIWGIGVGFGTWTSVRSTWGAKSREILNERYSCTRRSKQNVSAASDARSRCV